MTQRDFLLVASQDGGATGGQYLGPCVGIRMSKDYEFKLYALDIATLPADTDTYAEVKAALESGGASHGNVLGTASNTESFTALVRKLASKYRVP